MATITRIGLLGASRIARGAVIAPAADIDSVEVTRVAASRQEKAEAYAEEHGIPGVEADYAALVTSDAVDVVYNALPPSGHMQWSIAALEAGKDVLCEKPFAMNAAEAEQMVAAARATGRTLIEAFHYRFHPLFGRILEVLHAGTIGEIRSLAGEFNAAIPYQPGELRHELDVGGGALMDLGCYPVHWVRTVMGSEPRVLSARAVQEREGVDLAMCADLEFAGGVHGEIACSMATDLEPPFSASLSIIGDKGQVAVTNPMSPHSGHELSIESDAGVSSEVVDGHSTYFHQLEHMLRVIRGEARPITGGEDAIANMRLIDAIYRAAGMQPRGQKN